MTPRMLLISVSLGIIILNIFTVRYRGKKAEALEKKLRVIAQKKEGGVTIEEISEVLQLPLYDAKILARKFVTQGKIGTKKRGDEELYVFRSQP
jgi:predicted small secreted protein